MSAAIDLTNNFNLVRNLTNMFNASHGSCDYFLDEFFEDNDQFIIKRFWEIPIAEDRVKEIIPNKLYIAYVECINIATNTPIKSYVALSCEDDAFWGFHNTFATIDEAIFSIIVYIYDVVEYADNGTKHAAQLMRAYRNYRDVINTSNFDV